ncbi:hypothetical protein QBC46DRAFT_32926 [Diplogelasinospora grovesii]|uniref:SMODS and SLOG-associating 2TM effector domain-containing protein n=1 Tax=Diplogelasinospora grovesii TaxID=303347 RepID=A0AAN6N2N1_9PEZI|nr:hypothetical protein QBC46DRAFT_32926 [Diplogelasinospora grovesii]
MATNMGDAPTNHASLPPQPRASANPHHSESDTLFYPTERQSSIPLRNPASQTTNSNNNNHNNPDSSDEKPSPPVQPSSSGGGGNGNGNGFRPKSSFPPGFPSLPGFPSNYGSNSHHVSHRFLTPAEWARVAHGIGAIRENEDSHSVVHPTSFFWPPRGLPDGLYKDVVSQRTKYFYSYHILSLMRWTLMIWQLLLGAILTALGSVKLADGTAITILAAVNTIDAGLLGLMHNSGLPDRYRLNKVEFDKVEDHLKELLDSGIVQHGQTVDDVLSDCFQRYQNAKSTVLANMPENYTVSQAPNKERPLIVCPGPQVHGYEGYNKED